MQVLSLDPPNTDEYFEYYGGYINQVDSNEFASTFGSQCKQLQQLLETVSESRALVVDPPYHWTLKQVLGHLIDAERIFATRALRISAGDKTPNPSMDQDLYVANLNYQTVTLRDLAAELVFERGANICLLNRLTPEQLLNRGLASGYEISSRACFYIMAGHVAHHATIIEQRLSNVLESDES